jgi:hypothetical protein
MEVGVKLLLMRTLRLEISSARGQPVTPPGGVAQRSKLEVSVKLGAAGQCLLPPPLLAKSLC